MKDIFNRENLKTRVGILNIETFGNKHESQFFVHMTSGLGVEHRQPELYKVWQRIHGSMNETQFLTELIQQSVVHFDTTTDQIPWTFASPR